MPSLRQTDAAWPSGEVVFRKLPCPRRTEAPLVGPGDGVAYGTRITGSPRILAHVLADATVPKRSDCEDAVRDARRALDLVARLLETSG
jgi:hypothetical protein